MKSSASLHVIGEIAFSQWFKQTVIQLENFLTSFLAVSAEKPVKSHLVQAWNLTQFWSSVANTFLSICVRLNDPQWCQGDILSFHPDCLIFYFVINDNVPTVVQQHLSLVKQQIEQCRTLGCSHTREAFLFLPSLFSWKASRWPESVSGLGDSYWFMISIIKK